MLTIANVVSNDAGNYSVLVTNAYGTTNSQSAVLIIRQPGNVYWINSTGGNWSNPANWDSSHVPGTNDNVFIINDGNYTVTPGCRHHGKQSHSWRFERTTNNFN